MQSTQPASTLDDDAILALLRFANWEVTQDPEDLDWYIRPPSETYIGCSAFTNLQDALDYFCLYQRLYNK